MDVAKRHTDQLTRIKDTIKRAHDYFKPNYDRYNEFRRFVFDTSLKNEELTLLTTISKPQLEFNILEAYISRLLGEFSKQEPDIEVGADDQNAVDPMTIKVVEQHLRHVLTDAKNHHTKYEVYKDLLSGGFSTLKVTTDYANPMSFHQVINIERAEPTMCGFDQLAKYSHKGDGRFCFEMFPKSEEDFKIEYPNVSVDELSFRRDLSGFNWSYLNDTSRFLLVCDYYEKKKKEMKIVMLNNRKVMTMEKYNEMVEKWDNRYEMPPAIVGKPRKTELETIVRYRLIENKVLEHEETDFTMLPLIFVDGNSVMIRTPKNGNIRQMTRPYVYHAKGAQRLKNFSGIAIANEIENIVQHKFIIKKEALPKEEELLQSLKDIQKPNNIIVNAYYEEDPDKPIPEPIREIAKIPAPPEILQAFSGSDSLIQNILGSYDASLGINNNQLSGVALVEAASQSNAAAMPYIVGYLQGYQRAAEIYVDLMPKYYTTPRTLPVVDERGRKGYVMINQQEGMDMYYDCNALNVVVRAGASFQVQKSRTIVMVKEMMGMSPLFAQFIAEKGLDFVLDNMEGKGIEQLKQMVDSWLKEMQQQKQMAMQQQQQEMQNNPVMMKNKLEMAKLQHQAQKEQGQMQIDMMKLKQDEQKVMADVQISHDQNAVQFVKAMTERLAKATDLKLKQFDIHHKHLHDHAKLRHEMSTAFTKHKEARK